MALGAALIAAAPVRRQLRKLHLQSSIMAREVIAKRAAETEERQKTSDEILSVVRNSLFETVLLTDRSALPAWAEDAEPMILRAIGELRDQDEKRADPTGIAARRADVLTELERLADSVEALQLPSKVRDAVNMGVHPIDDPELEELDRQATEAALDLKDAYERFRRAIRELDNAFITELIILRLRIQEIDNLIINEEVHRT